MLRITGRGGRGEGGRRVSEGSWCKHGDLTQQVFSIIATPKSRSCCNSQVLLRVVFITTPLINIEHPLKV